MSVIVIASTRAIGERHAQHRQLASRDYIVLTPHAPNGCRGRRFTDDDSFDVLDLPGFTERHREQFLYALIPCGPPASAVSRIVEAFACDD